MPIARQRRVLDAARFDDKPAAITLSQLIHVTISPYLSALPCVIADLS